MAPIDLGPVRLDPPVYLAPMSGVGDYPFRRLAKRLGAPVTVSEMIASHEAIRETRATMARLTFDAAERPRIVQIAGHEPAVMAEAARLCVDLGADMVDINFGCPAKKVTNKLCGSALMRDEALAGRILHAVVGAVDVPVSLKMRLGWDDDSRNAPVLARIAEGAGIRLLTVHGRTRCQLNAGRADWRFVARVKAATRLPVVVNGDIDGPESLRAALAASGADGAMVGRACYGRPWLPGALAEVARGRPMPREPDPAARLALVLEHYDLILSHHGTARGVRTARKHLSWYVNGLPGAAETRRAIMGLEEPAAVSAALKAFFAPLGDREAA